MPPDVKIRRMIRGFLKMLKTCSPAFSPETDLLLKSKSDIYLIQEIKDGNGDAFRILAERYNYIISGNISKFYPSFRCNSDREDLYQECRIVLYKAAKFYDLMKNAKFSTYANICVKNYLVSLRRKYGSGKRQCDIVPLDEILENEHGKCDRYFAFNDFHSFFETIETLKISFCELSAFERNVLMMYIENKSYKHIAQILNKSVKSIDNAICRIKSKLKPYAEYFVSEY